MPEQLTLDRALVRPPLTDRLFFALLPDGYAATQADRFRQRLLAETGLTGMPVRTDDLHVTLHHLGDHAGVPADLVTRAASVAGTLVASPFEAEFEAVMSLARGSRQEPLVLCGGHGLAALIAFQRALGVAMIKGGLAQWVNQDFTPHMTLAYDPQRVVRQDIRPISWMVKELVLVHSLLGQRRRVILGRWPLRGPKAARPGEGGGVR